tara:strand:- start:70 stop:255 length:186 start_codon:yes stop_codon:yes gene_type:complete
MKKKNIGKLQMCEGFHKTSLRGCESKYQKMTKGNEAFLKYIKYIYDRRITPNRMLETENYL